jgi:phosphoribosylanthranilate isomerase
VWVKVCGLTRADDVRLCLELGVDAVGFIFAPGGKRTITPEQAAAMPTGAAARVGVFVGQGADEVRDIMRLATLDYAQLHGDESPEVCRAVGPERVIKVVWPQRLLRGDNDVDSNSIRGSTPYPGRDLPDIARPRCHAGRAGTLHPHLGMDIDRQFAAEITPEALAVRLQSLCAPFADCCAMFLLDAGMAGGGGGRPLPWELLDGLTLPKPWILAGGLGPDNVAEALAACSPFGVDGNSALECSPGVKDHEKLRAFVQGAGDFAGTSHIIPPEGAAGQAR